MAAGTDDDGALPCRSASEESIRWTDGWGGCASRGGSPDSSAETLKGPRLEPSPTSSLVSYTLRVRTGDVRGAGTDAGGTHSDLSSLRR